MKSFSVPCIAVVTIWAVLAPLLSITWEKDNSAPLHRPQLCLLCSQAVVTEQHYMAVPVSRAGLGICAEVICDGTSLLHHLWMEIVSISLFC